MHTHTMLMLTTTTYTHTLSLFQARSHQAEMAGSHRPLISSVPLLLLHLLLFLLFLLGPTAAQSQQAPPSPPPPPPHIILIVADDQGHNDIGYTNSQNENIIQTPTLDHLAEHAGVKLTSFYTQSVCSPSRASLLTGKYTIHLGLQHSIVQSGHPNALGTEHHTIAEALKAEKGYATHMVGKWHLGYYKKKFQPHHRGFDTFYGMLTGAEYYFSHQARCEYPYWDCQGPTACWGLDWFDGDEPVLDEDGQYSTDLLTRRAEKIIMEHPPEKPLFLYVPYQAVHGRLEAPEEVIERFAYVEDEERRVYAAMIWKLDEGVRNITRALQESGLYNNSVMVFLSDNGGHHAFGGNNWPLRAEKGSYFEGGIRVPAFVHSPLLTQRGGNVIQNDLMHVSDLFPTLVGGVAGVNRENEVLQGLDGVDQWPTILEGIPSPRQELLHTIDPLGLAKDEDPLTGTKQAVLRQGPWKLILGAPGQNANQDGWIPPPKWKPGKQELEKKAKEAAHLSPDCKPCKFTRQNLTTGVCLFDIENDPTERCNLAEARPEKVRGMLDRLAAYNATAVPPQYPGPDDRCDPSRTGNVFVAWGEEDEEEGGGVGRKTEL